MSRSAYYAWLKKGEGPSEADLDEAYLANAIYDIWKKSRRRYGVPRVTAALAKQGARGQREAGGPPHGPARHRGHLAGGARSRRPGVTPTTSRPPTWSNGTSRADEPDELWLTDLTYIATDEGWLYLCSILDVFSRRLLGWSLADHMRTELCTDALDAAAMVRGRGRFAGTVLHSDHGCQYTSEDFRSPLQQLGIVQSMGSVGDCYDNAMMESAWSSLKRELVYETHFTTREEARRAVFEWIIWYNS